MSLDIEVNHADDLSDDAELIHTDADTVVRAAVAAALADRGVQDAAVSVTLVGDDGIANLNQQYLGHEGPTDVISFPLFEQGERPVGDIYIGAAQARRQAQDLGIPLRQELARLAIHGTLHVLGYEHPDNEERENSELWRLQEAILRRLANALS